MIRKAEKSDFPFVYPILKQIFDEMQMETINKLPESQFYDLMRLGYISEDYRYSYRRIWVDVNDQGEVLGILDMYSYDDQKIIDFVLKNAYAKVGLPIDTVIFSDHWGEGVASRLMDTAVEIAKKYGYSKISLNVDKENPRAQKLYEHKGYKTTNSMTIGDRTYDHMVKEI